MYVLTNGRIVTENEELTGYDLVIQGARISAIVPEGDFSVHPEVDIIDANGGYILPGFVDIHADYIERMAAPRPTSIMDFEMSLREAERELVTHGITTMFHSLSFYKFTEFTPSPIRSPENTERFIGLIASMHESRHLIRHRFHARFELDNLDRIDELTAYIRERRIHLVSFMDHTPGQGQYRNLEIYRKTLKGYRDVSDEEIDGIIEKSKGRNKLTEAHIREIVELAQSMGIAVASHDDDTVDKLALVKSFGASISEFPITIDVAREARRLGMHSVAGAPNVMLGGSHSGNLSATEAILADCVDVLCSDYYPPSMLHAAFLLHGSHGLPIHEAVRLVTLNPAKAVMMDKEIGSIERGKRADILVVELIDGKFPAVTSTIVNGQLVFTTAYRGVMA